MCFHIRLLFNNINNRDIRSTLFKYRIYHITILVYPLALPIRQFIYFSMKNINFRKPNNARISPVFIYPHSYSVGAVYNLAQTGSMALFVHIFQKTRNYVHCITVKTLDQYCAHEYEAVKCRLKDVLGFLVVSIIFSIVAFYSSIWIIFCMRFCATILTTFV